MGELVVNMFTSLDGVLQAGLRRTREWASQRCRAIVLIGGN